MRVIWPRAFRANKLTAYLSALLLPERRLRRFAVGLAVFSREFDFQALFAARHGPAMVGSEDWFEDGGEEFQERFFGADAPVVGDFDGVAGLGQGPFAAADEVAEGFDDEAVRFGFEDAEAPAQRVREPAFCVELDDVAALFHVDVDRRPPVREVLGVAEDVDDFVDLPADAPVGDEVVVVKHKTF